MYIILTARGKAIGYRENKGVIGNNADNKFMISKN